MRVRLTNELTDILDNMIKYKLDYHLLYNYDDSVTIVVEHNDEEIEFVVKLGDEHDIS